MNIVEYVYGGRDKLLKSTAVRSRAGNFRFQLAKLQALYVWYTLSADQALIQSHFDSRRDSTIPLPPSCVYVCVCNECKTRLLLRSRACIAGIYSVIKKKKKITCRSWYCTKWRDYIAVNQFDVAFGASMIRSVYLLLFLWSFLLMLIIDAWSRLFNANFFLTHIRSIVYLYSILNNNKIRRKAFLFRSISVCHSICFIEFICGDGMLI